MIEIEGARSISSPVGKGAVDSNCVWSTGKPSGMMESGLVRRQGQAFMKNLNLRVLMWNTLIGVRHPTASLHVHANREAGGMVSSL